MSSMYPECTVCQVTLTMQEKKRNEEHGIVYHPICDRCLSSSVDRIVEIAEEEEEDRPF